MEKERWVALKNGSVKPSNDEERTALKEYYNDRNMLMRFRTMEMLEPTSDRQRRENCLCSYRKKEDDDEY